MAVESYTRFKLVSPHYGDDQYMTQLENNVQQWLQWGLLGIGGWRDVSIPTSGAYGGDFSRLRPVTDSNYTDGQIWEGARKDWVWETGVNYVDTTGGTGNPTPVGVPDIDGSPAAGSYHVDYRNGRVIFDTAISTSSTVQVAHSFRSTQVYRADTAPWYQEAQLRSNRPDSSQFLQEASGTWSVNARHRIQLPCIVVGAVPSAHTTPFQLGNGKLWIHQDMMFHVFAETRSDRNKLCSILMAQTDMNIWLFDTNAVAADEAYPLDYRGELTGSIQYPDLVSETGYQWRRCRFERGNAEELEVIHPNLYEGRIRLLAEFDH